MILVKIPTLHNTQPIVLGAPKSRNLAFLSQALHPLQLWPRSHRVHRSTHKLLPLCQHRHQIQGILPTSFVHLKFLPPLLVKFFVLLQLPSLHLVPSRFQLYLRLRLFPFLSHFHFTIVVRDRHLRSGLVSESGYHRTQRSEPQCQCRSRSKKLGRTPLLGPIHSVNPLFTRPRVGMPLPYPGLVIMQICLRTTLTALPRIAPALLPTLLSSSLGRFHLSHQHL
jgi:hypothetical protein